MNVNVLSRTTIHESVLDEARAHCNKVLDAKWDSLWIKDSISKKDIDAAGQLFIHGKEVSEKSDVLLILPTKQSRHSIESVVSMAKSQISDMEVYLCPDSLDPKDQEELINLLEGKAVTLFVVALGKEDLVFRANYAIYKKLAFQIANKQLEERERIYVALDESSETVAQDASENNYPAMRFPEGTDPNYLANSIGVAFPLLAMGIDLEEYLKGFYDTVAAPDWDRDAGLFGYFLSKAAPKEIGLYAYQREVKPLLNWLKAIIDSKIKINENTKTKTDSHGLNLDILIGSEKSPLDIMTPSFQGCDPDGSLSALNRRNAKDMFFQREEPGFNLEIEDFSSYSIGSLMAFLQISALLMTE